MKESRQKPTTSIRVDKGILHQGRIAAVTSKKTLGQWLEEAIAEKIEREKVKKVVFSGGVFQNKYLVARLRRLFAGTGLKIYFHENFPTTDASIALGQAACCAVKSYPHQ